MQIIFTYANVIVQHSVIVHYYIDMNRTQTSDSSGTPHNTLVVHYVTIHYTSPF